MKRKHDGWHTLDLNGGLQTCFCYMGRIAKHTPENDPAFQSKVEFLVKELKSRLRAGKMTKKGKPHAHSVLSRWLCDICNHVYTGSWSEQDISEGHLNLVAKDLGWPEVWKRGGDVLYCVDCGDYMSISMEIDMIRSVYPQNRVLQSLNRR